MEIEKLNAILAAHLLWINNTPGGIRADLINARLVGARLDGARLDHASLDHARLDHASLVGARLDGARLDGARLDHARLDHASLDGARLDGARASSNRLFARQPLQISGCRYLIVETASKGIRIGCESNVTSDKLDSLFATFSTPFEMRPLYIAAVKLIEEYAHQYPLTKPIET